jgi:hypothetical protein
MVGQTVMTSGNVGLDMSGGHDIAYAKIMEECSGWCADCRPIFVREGSEAIGNWPVLAEKVSIWMEDAKLIAVGGYKQVLEDGQDRGSSDSDSEHGDHGDEMSNESMYTPEMLGPDGTPKNGGPQRLSSTQALALRAAARSAPSSSGPSRTRTPSTSTTEGEDSVDEWYREHPEVPKCGKEVSSRLPTPLNSDNEDEEEYRSKDQTRCLSPAKRMAGRARRTGGPGQSPDHGKRICVRHEVALLILELSSFPPRRVFSSCACRELRIRGFGTGFQKGSMPNRASARVSGGIIHPFGA